MKGPCASGPQIGCQRWAKNLEIAAGVRQRGSSAPAPSDGSFCRSKSPQRQRWLNPLFRDVAGLEICHGTRACCQKQNPFGGKRRYTVVGLLASAPGSRKSRPPVDFIACAQRAHIVNKEGSTIMATTLCLLHCAHSWKLCQLSLLPLPLLLTDSGPGISPCLTRPRMLLPFRGKRLALSLIFAPF